MEVENSSKKIVNVSLSALILGLLFLQARLVFSTNLQSQPVSTVASTTSSNPLGMSSRSHTFFDLGLAWLFYSTGSGIVCTATADGQHNWSFPVEVTSDPNMEAFSLYENSTSHELFMAQTNSGTMMNVGYTLVSSAGCDSAVAGDWTFNQTVTVQHTFSSDPTITATSDNNIFVGLTTENATSNPRIGYTEIWKYNGSWFGQTIASWGGGYVPDEANSSADYYPNWADPTITASSTVPGDLAAVAIESFGATQKGGYAFFFYSTNDGNSWTEAPDHSSDKYSDTYGGAYMFGTTMDVVASGNSPINYFNYTIGNNGENSTDREIMKNALESAVSFASNGDIFVLFSGGADPQNGEGLFYTVSYNYGSTWSNETQLANDSSVTFPQTPLTFGNSNITVAWENSTNPDAKGVRSTYLQLEEVGTSVASLITEFTSVSSSPSTSSSNSTITSEISSPEPATSAIQSVLSTESSTYSVSNNASSYSTSGTLSVLVAVIAIVTGMVLALRRRSFREDSHFI